MIEQERIARMAPHIDALVNHLAKRGVTYHGFDELGNVVFKYKTKEKRIRGIEFYRVNGIYSYRKMITEQFFELTPMSDSMFYGSFMKTVLEFVFFPPESTKKS